MPDGVPSPEALEALGARIGRVDIEVEDIFDPTNPAEHAAPYRLANKLHVNTHEDTVRSQLLFAESEPYSKQKVEETERLLRGRRYVFDAHIAANCYHEVDQTVDMSVRVRDVWSLNPGFSFSRKGGENGTGLEIEDQDFMGRGELLSLGWKSDVDRTSLRLLDDDPQLFGTLVAGSSVLRGQQRRRHERTERWAAVLLARHALECGHRPAVRRPQDVSLSRRTCPR